MRPLTHTLAVVLLALGWLPGLAGAQGLPPAQWSEPVLVQPEPTAPGPDEADPQAGVDIGEVPAPLTQEQVEALNARAQAATATVRARVRSDPLLVPVSSDREGAAVWVAPDQGPPLLLTTLGWLQDAESVCVVTETACVPVRLLADARYGLALLVPQRALSLPADPLPLLPVSAERSAEVLSGLPGSVGATLGAGPGQYEFYALSSLWVTSGYPLINRRGELLALGSHAYPLDPALSLVVPSQSIEQFLTATEADRIDAGL
jgi:hypothetical protein